MSGVDMPGGYKSGKDKPSEDAKVGTLSGQGNQKYLNIKVGEGGTFTYPTKRGQSMVPINAAGETEGRHAVFVLGTTHCHNGLGVYFQLSHKRCFCAHIDVYNGKKEGGPFTVDEHMEVSAQVTRRLRDHAASHGWDRDDVFRDTIIMVCNRPNEVAGVIRDGVEDFLHLLEDISVDINAPMHAMILNPGLYWSDRVGALVLLPGNKSDNDEEHDFQEIQFPTSSDPKRWTYTTGFQRTSDSKVREDRGWGAKFIPRSSPGGPFREWRIV